MTSPRSARERVTRRGLLASGAASLVLGACTKSGAVTSDAPARSTTRTVHVDGVPLTYVRMGSGPPLVLIHGASGNLNDWTFRAAPALAERFTVIAFDRPGHGQSGLPKTGGERLSVQASLLRRALDQIGFDRALVAGHSYGGSVALAWALDAPSSVAGLLLLSAPSQVWDGGLGLSTDLLANALSGPVLARTLPSIVTAGFARSAADRVFAPQTAPEGYVEHLDLAQILQPASLRINALQLSALKEQVRELVPNYPNLSMPVEIVHGTADTTVPPDIHAIPSAAQIPGARLTLLDGIGHMPHHVAFPAAEAAIERLAARSR